MKSEISQADPNRLAGLFDGDSGCDWSVEDLRKMLWHQLSTPLVLSIPAPALDLDYDQQLLTTLRYGDLLTQPTPSLELLRSAKNFAKGSDGKPACLPAELGTLLYYAPIMAAHVRLGKWITQLSPHEAIQGVEWALSLEWLTPELRLLFQSAKELLQNQPASGAAPIGEGEQSQ